MNKKEIMVDLFDSVMFTARIFAGLFGYLITWLIVYDNCVADEWVRASVIMVLMGIMFAQWIKGEFSKEAAAKPQKESK
jgi:hypothetical protein